MADVPQQGPVSLYDSLFVGNNNRGCDFQPWLLASTHSSCYNGYKIVDKTCIWVFTFFRRRFSLLRTANHPKTQKGFISLAVNQFVFMDACVPAFKMLRQEHRREFEASLTYMVTSSLRSTEMPCLKITTIKRKQLWGPGETAKWVKCHTSMSSGPWHQDKKLGMIAHNPKLRRQGQDDSWACWLPS